MQEVWRPVVGFEGLYEVSDQGRVRSLSRYVTIGNGNKRWYEGRILDGDYGDKYRRLSLGNKLVRVHVAVLEAFVGLRPKGYVARHLNGNALDNRLCNLAWGTCKENAQDAMEHGTTTKGSRSGTAKLTEEDVVKIKNLLGKCKQRAIAKMFNVSEITIHDIKIGKTWSHLSVLQ
jgi:hypothetical protein